MSTTVDLLRGELERLFSLDEMTGMSERLLDFRPEDVGGADAKGSFARALTERCVATDRLEALVDVLFATKRDVDPRVKELLRGEGAELPAGQTVGALTVVRRLGASELATTYLAEDGEAGGAQVWLKVLRPRATRDRAALHRWLAATRLLATTVSHPGLPQNVRAGELSPGVFGVVHAALDGQPLAQRAGRAALSFQDARTLVQGILEPLAALHKAQLVHGDLGLESIWVDRSGRIVLADFATDRLLGKGPVANGHAGVLAVVGSPRTVAPELVRGQEADARSDIYAVGALLYELLTGRPVFPVESPVEAAFSHHGRDVEAPSTRAPSGWVSRDVDQLVLGFLAKDPARRPRDAQAALAALEALGRNSGSLRAAAPVAPAKLDELVSKLLASPGDADVALELEKAADDGGSAAQVAGAFETAAEAASGETRKALLYRAARTWDAAAGDKAKAEASYVAILALDPSDDVAASALESVRKALGKYEEIVEMLLERSQAASPGEERARVFAEIGRLYAHELDDGEQASVAFAQALVDMPQDRELADEVERACGVDAARWNEALGTLTEAIAEPGLAPADRVALLGHAGKWYADRVQRPDLALMAYQELLTAEPANEAAAEAMTTIYRRAQQWPELVALLGQRATSATTAPRARDLKVEAAEILETRLNDLARASEVYEQVASEDPGHVKATDALARLAEKMGDFAKLATILERRADASTGPGRADVLARLAEVHEDHLGDLAEATRRFEAVLAVDPGNLAALKGLDRIFNRSGKYRELLEVLERQVAVAATPRQKINLHERIAALHDEEFLDHAAAAESLEAVLRIDASNDGALTQLVRHYRALDKWDRVVALYERHAAAVHDDARKVELLLSAARTLTDPIGSPERATKVYEKALEVQPGNAAALEALAQLREMTGDAHAALTAIEALASKAATPEAKAEQWMRAGRLLEGRGDRDGAIQRFKIALEANPKDTTAAVALRKAYAAQGDTLGVVALIEQELAHAESDLARARLHAEAARLHHASQGDVARAEAAAKRALDLDATNAVAQAVLGDLAYEAGRMLEAAKYYEQVAGRSAVLDKDHAVQVLVRFLEAFGKTQARPSVPPPALSLGDLSGPASIAPPSTTAMPPSTANPRVLQAVESLQQLAPNDLDAIARAANALFEFGDPKAAYKMHADLFRRHGGELAGSERAELLFHLGESARRSGELDQALAPLREAIDLDPSNPRPFRALARVYDAKEAWTEALAVRKKRLGLASGAERFELLLETGEILFAKVGDRVAASKAFSSALQERPDDRRLLTKLMALYSEEKNWAKLVDVVLRLAEFVEESRQRAKYLHTAATITAKQIGNVDEALGFYERAIEHDPSLSKALEEATELYKKKGKHGDVERLLNRQLDAAKDAGDRERIVTVLDELGELYRSGLKEPELAIDAFEAAQAFDPDSKERSEKLAELYARDPKQYLDKAVKAQAQILRRNPYRVESYKLLRKLYTDARLADPSWCLAQALTVLRQADADEERFYKKHRAENAAPARSVLDETTWAALLHEDLDPLVTRVFQIIQPSIVKSRTQPLSDLGYDARYAIDCSMHPYPMSQTIYYVQGVLAQPAPLVFQNPQDPGVLGFVHGQPAAMVVGKAAFEGGLANQSLAFHVGRHLTYYRPGLYVRHLVPTGTGLKAWLFAAIKLCVPQFPIAADLGGQVQEAMAAMQADFSGGERDKLASAVSKLLQAGGALDLKRWVASIDLTADRVGFLLAHDLTLTTEALRSTEASSAVPVKERMKEIVVFSVSEEYFAVRKALGIGIDA